MCKFLALYPLARVEDRVNNFYTAEIPQERHTNSVGPPCKNRLSVQFARTLFYPQERRGFWMAAKPPDRFPAFPKGYGRHPAARFQSRRGLSNAPPINARRSRAHGRALVVAPTHQRPAKPGKRADRSGRGQIGLAPPHGHGRSPARRRKATAHDVKAISSPVRAGGCAGTPPHSARTISRHVRGRWAAGGAAGRQNNYGCPAERRTPTA